MKRFWCKIHKSKNPNGQNSKNTAESRRGKMWGSFKWLNIDIKTSAGMFNVEVPSLHFSFLKHPFFFFIATSFKTRSTVFLF